MAVLILKNISNMLVFISYPREFEAVAAALDAELKSRRIDTFLDRRSLNPTDVWRLEIESNIKKAAVFVVLYSLEAAKKNRYFLIETELIQAACEKSLQRIITVIFDPTKATDLPEFFQRRQILVSETQGTSRDERDSYWIDKIVQEVNRVNKIKKKIIIRQYIARTFLTVGVVIIALLSFNLFGTKETLNNVSKELEAVQARIPDGKSLCNTLVGNYRLHQKYIFTAEADTRSVATHGTWKATGCEYKVQNNTYILKGEDDTEFDIEVIIKGRYERIATIRYIYSSEVSINREGKLLRRSFESVPDPHEVRRYDKDRDGNDLNKPESFYKEKIDRAIELRNEKHKASRTTPCIPTLGELGDQITVAFICQGYTRVMVKVS